MFFKSNSLVGALDVLRLDVTRPEVENQEIS